MAGRGGQGNQTTVPHLPAPPARPPGLWLRAAVEYPRPLSPFTAAWLLPSQSAASRPALRGIGAMIDRIEYREIGGYVYRRVVPFGPQRPPFVVFRPIAKALVRLRPATRRRMNEAIRTMRSRGYEAVLDRWEAEWLPSLDRAAQRLGANDPEGADDRSLDQELEQVVRLAQDGTRQYAQAFLAAAVTLGHFLLEARRAGLDEVGALAALAVQADPASGGVAEDRRGAVGTDGREALDWAPFPLRREAAEPAAAEVRLVARREDPALRSADYDLDLPASAPDSTTARRAYAILSEAAPLAIDRPLALARRTALPIGRRLVQRGQVEEVGDVFFLTPDEARAALRGGEQQHERVAARREARAQAASRRPPRTIGNAPQWPLDLLAAEARAMVEAILAVLAAIEGRALLPGLDQDQTAGAAATTPVAPRHVVAGGLAAGPVRRLRSVADLAALQSGDVAVCESATVSLAAYAGGCAAIVAGEGGALSPVAIVARRLGVPLAVDEGFDGLADGQRVEVDGDAGTVRRVPG